MSRTFRYNPDTKDWTARDHKTIKPKRRKHDLQEVTFRNLRHLECATSDPQERTRAGAEDSGVDGVDETNAKRTEGEKE